MFRQSFLFFVVMIERKTHVKLKDGESNAT